MSEPSPRPISQGDHLYLIDGSGYIFRAYHALPPLTRKSDGLPVGAVQGFCAMLNKLLRETAAGRRPTHLAVIFDKSARSFRNDIFTEYKATRTEPPADLIPQFGLIRQATRAFCVSCIEQDNYEADDLIATYARQAVEKGATVHIVSSDKDLMQLVRDGVTLYDTMKDKEIGAAEVLEKFGVPPSKVVEVQALAGDSIDNIPGVPGIGVKTGAALIAEYGDLETLLARAHEIKQPKRRENLMAFAEQARLSRQLVILKDDVEVEHPIDDFAVTAPRPADLIGFLKALEFTTLTRRIAADIEADAAIIEPVAVTIRGWPPEGVTIEAVSAVRTATGPAAAAPTHHQPLPPGEVPPPAPAVTAPLDAGAYQTITTLERLEHWLNEATMSGSLGFKIETTSLDPMRAEVVGVSLATAPGKAAYVPLAHRNAAGLDFSDQTIAQVEREGALARLKTMLANPAVLKIGHNQKYDALVLARLGIALAPIDDVMLVSYALDSGKHGHGLDELSQRHLDHKPMTFKEAAGSGRTAVTFDLVPVDVATRYAAEDADIALRLWHILKPRLAAEHQATVYETLERPLVPVLAVMEREGILVDRPVLARLSGEFGRTAETIEDEVYRLAGGPFNIGSPKQLGDVLFGSMGIPGGRKTATGAWSTDSQVMEELAAAGVELARKVLDWRQVAKLKSTYTDSLPGYIHPETGRVHTSYQLAATSTGRLASTEPNLQNIPIRSDEGRKIRSAFIAAPGSKLISADYSQIELRVFAHVADIPQLKTAFAEGFDIHAMTASEMFGVPVEGMDPHIRRRAKAINFGIIYGISAFGLANQLAIPREEAGLYIKTYFERFPGIRDYMEETKRFCRETGYVETVFGRRCHFPRIRASNPSERANQERAAINAPIQGSAADIIRRAMIRMPAALAAAGLKARMLLQVHDELIFEAVEDEVEATMVTAIAVMQKASEPAVRFSVPIQVDARAASNWEEAH